MKGKSEMKSGKVSGAKETKMIKKSEKASDKKMGSMPPMKPVKKGK